MEGLEACAADWESVRESWEAERKRAADEREGWEEERDAWERERAKWRLGWDEHKGDADSLRASLSELSEAHSLLQSKVDESDGRLVTARKSLEEAEEKIKSLRAQIEEREEVVGLEELLECARAETAHARGGLEQAEGERAALRGELDDAVKERDALAEERDALSALVSEKDSAIKDAEAEKSRHAHEVMGLSRQLEEAHARGERDAEAAKRDAASLQKELEREREAREEGWHKLVEARGEAEGWRIACGDKARCVCVSCSRV